MRTPRGRPRDPPEMVETGQERREGLPRTGRREEQCVPPGGNRRPAMPLRRRRHPIRGPGTSSPPRGAARRVRRRHLPSREALLPNIKRNRPTQTTSLIVAVRTLGWQGGSKRMFRARWHRRCRTGRPGGRPPRHRRGPVRSSPARSVQHSVFFSLTIRSRHERGSMAGGGRFRRHPTPVPCLFGEQMCFETRPWEGHSSRKTWGECHFLACADPTTQTMGRGAAHCRSEMARMARTPRMMAMAMKWISHRESSDAGRGRWGDNTGRGASFTGDDRGVSPIDGRDHDGGDRGRRSLCMGAVAGSASPRSRSEKATGDEPSSSARRRRSSSSKTGLGGRKTRAASASAPRIACTRDGSVQRARSVCSSGAALVAVVGVLGHQLADDGGERRGDARATRSSGSGSSIRCLKILVTTSPPSNGGRPARVK